MAFDREAAKQAGYSDDEINAYMQAEAEKNKTEAPAPVVADVGEPPAPTTVVKPIESSAASVTTTGALAAAPYVGAGALGAGALYGGKLAKDAFTAMREANAMKQAHIDLQYQKMAQAAEKAAGGPKPVSPSPILDAAGRPMAPSTGPVAPGAAPTPTAPAQAQPSLLDKTTNMVRQLAANKVFQNLAKGGAGVAAALTPGNIGQDYMVPQQGRMRGMEINPMTGRPWTREQLQAYNANPAMFDTALGQAQMPR